MSVATEFPPTVFVPERARRQSSSAAPRAASRAVLTRRPPLRLVPVGEGCQPMPSRSVKAGRQGGVPVSARAADTAVVAALPLPPSSFPAGSVQLRRRALRLTRRGVLAVALGVAAAGGLLLLIAHLSVGAPQARPAVAPAAVVTVQPGDTLWSIAGQVYPGRDPRLVVERIRRSNHLNSVSLSPGQTLKVG